MSQRLLDRQTLNSLIEELSEISDLAIAEDAQASNDVERLRKQTEQLAALSDAASTPVESEGKAPTGIAEPAPQANSDTVSAETDESDLAQALEPAESANTSPVASETADAPLTLSFDERSDTLELEWDYTQDRAVMSQRVHRSIENWLEHMQLRGALSQLQLDFVQLANSGEAPQQWRCTLQKNKGRQRHLQVLCEYKKQRQLTAHAVIHTH